MKNRRYNPFNLVHKGLRAYMFDTALRLQSTDLVGDVLSITVVEQVAQLLDAVETHACREDHLINEPLESLDPKMSNLFQREHELNQRLGIVIKNLLLDWYNAGNDTMRTCIVTRLTYAFNEFIVFNLDHMNREEIEINRILWKNYSDEEIHVTGQRLLQSVPPQKIAGSIRWIVRGINDYELVQWMKMLRKESSQFSFEMTSIIEQELDISRMERIEDLLCLPAQSSPEAN